MRICCTGGTGFLGRNLSKYFEDHWDEFCQKHPDSQVFFVGSGKNKEFDLTTEKGAEELFSKYYPIDTVIALAAKCGGIGLNNRLPVDLAIANLKIGVNTFECIRKFHIERIYLGGTICSFPMNCPSYPFKEDDLFNGLSEISNRPYSDAKRMQFTLFDAYRKQYGLKGAKLLIANQFGKEDSFDLNDSHVIPALIRKFVTAKKNEDNKVYCWGTGIAEREFLYAEETARTIFLAVKNELDTDLPINVGSGEEICIGDLAYLIAELIDYHGEIIFDGSVSDGQLRRKLDISRAKELIGFENQVKLKDGLKQTIQWYLENYEG